MIPQILSHSYSLIGRSLPILMAFQPAARPPGASGPTAGSGGGGQINPTSQILMLVAVVGFMYLFVLRPENKRRKDQEDLNRALRPGDKVVTTGGLVGTIVTVDDRELTLEIADRVKARFMREAVLRKYDAAAPAGPTSDVATSKKS